MKQRCYALSDDVLIRLQRGYAISGDVLDDDGKLAAGVEIVLMLHFDVADFRRDE